jgi:hypothetical protein
LAKPVINMWSLMYGYDDAGFMQIAS